MEAWKKETETESISAPLMHVLAKFELKQCPATSPVVLPQAGEP